MSTPELDFNNMVRLNADKDRDTSLQLGVFRGGASMAVFNGPGAPKLKIPFQRMGLRIIPHFLQQLKKNPNPEYKAELPITKWNPETKKQDPIATVVFGRDEKNIPFIGVSSPMLSKPAKFLIRLPFGMDLTQMTVVEQSSMALDMLTDVFVTHIPVAMSLTSFKREFNGNRQGGGGGSYGGGQNSNQSSGGGASKSTGDDEIVF